jgi:hypothetical protein
MGRVCKHVEVHDRESVDYSVPKRLLTEIQTVKEIVVRAQWKWGE